MGFVALALLAAICALAADARAQPAMIEAWANRGSPEEAWSLRIVENLGGAAAGASLETTSLNPSGTMLGAFTMSRASFNRLLVVMQEQKFCGLPAEIHQAAVSVHGAVISVSTQCVGELHEVRLYDPAAALADGEDQGAALRLLRVWNALFSELPAKPGFVPDIEPMDAPHNNQLQQTGGRPPAAE